MMLAVRAVLVVGTYSAMAAALVAAVIATLRAPTAPTVVERDDSRSVAVRRPLPAAGRESHPENRTGPAQTRRDR